MKRGSAHAAILMLVILILSINGVQRTFAEAIEATWGSPLKLRTQEITEDEIIESGKQYGAVLLFSANSFEPKIQDVLTKVVADSVQSLQDKGFKPIYVNARAENVSCNIVYWCNYDIRLTTHFESPKQQVSIVTWVVIAIILVIVAYLAYITYRTVERVIKFIQENPIEASIGFIAIAAVAVAVLVLAIYRRRVRR